MAEEPEADRSPRPATGEERSSGARRPVGRGGTPVRAGTRAEAVEVAERHGYGEFVEVVRLNPWSRGFGTAVAFAVPPAFFGVLLLARAAGDVLGLVGGVLLTALAAGLLALGVVALRQRNPRPGSCSCSPAASSSAWTACWTRTRGRTWS